VGLYLLYRGIRDRRYFRGIGERLGSVPSNSTGVGAVWFHAVSVGEVLAAAALIERVRREKPLTPVFLSTSTLAGRALANQKIGQGVFFAPLDYRFAVRRVLRRIRPAVVVVLETEIWPNLYR
jgi:3-deoxy-D-manno-octulosonic-acid transferase